MYHKMQQKKINQEKLDEMVMNIYFDFFRLFLKVLELFKCCRDDP